MMATVALVGANFYSVNELWTVTQESQSLKLRIASLETQIGKFNHDIKNYLKLY